MATPGRGEKIKLLMDLKERLDKCWRLSLEWNLYPEHIKKVII